MQNPLVSIIVACYNQAQYLSEALDSILAQSYSNWECIIVNDGSPDNTEEIAKQYCIKDNRFKYLYKQNGGLSSARNAGVKAIKGEFIQFLDSDDLIAPQKIEKQIAAFNKNDKLSISITSFYFFDINRNISHPSIDRWNNIISSDFRNDILFRWDINFSIPIHSALFKSEIIESIPFNEQLYAKEDWLFWIEISNNAPIVDYIDEELAFYRINPISMSKNKKLMQSNNVKVLFFILEQFKDENNEEKIIFQKRMEEDILKLFKDQIENDLINELSKVRYSKAYRLGKFILKPFSFIRHNILKK